jgi:hypothetical protein
MIFDRLEADEFYRTRLIYKLRLTFLPIAVNEAVAFGRMGRHALLDLAARHSCSDRLLIRYAHAATTHLQADCV